MAWTPPAQAAAGSGVLTPLYPNLVWSGWHNDDDDGVAVIESFTDASKSFKANWNGDNKVRRYGGRDILPHNGDWDQSAYPGPTSPAVIDYVGDLLKKLCPTEGSDFPMPWGQHWFTYSKEWTQFTADTGGTRRYQVFPPIRTILRSSNSSYRDRAFYTEIRGWMEAQLNRPFSHLWDYGELFRPMLGDYEHRINPAESGHKLSHPRYWNCMARAPGYRGVLDKNADPVDWFFEWIAQRRPVSLNAATRTFSVGAPGWDYIPEVGEPFFIWGFANSNNNRQGSYPLYVESATSTTVTYGAVSNYAPVDEVGSNIYLAKTTVWNQFDTPHGTTEPHIAALAAGHPLGPMMLWMHARLSCSCYPYGNLAGSSWDSAGYQTSGSNQRGHGWWMCMMANYYLSGFQWGDPDLLTAQFRTTDIRQWVNWQVYRSILHSHFGGYGKGALLAYHGTDAREDQWAVLSTKGVEYTDARGNWGRQLQPLSQNWGAIIFWGFNYMLLVDDYLRTDLGLPGILDQSFVLPDSSTVDIRQGMEDMRDWWYEWTNVSLRWHEADPYNQGGGDRADDIGHFVYSHFWVGPSPNSGDVYTPTTEWRVPPSYFDTEAEALALIEWVVTEADSTISDGVSVTVDASARTLTAAENFTQNPIDDPDKRTWVEVSGSAHANNNGIFRVVAVLDMRTIEIDGADLTDETAVLKLGKRTLDFWRPGECPTSSNYYNNRAMREIHTFQLPYGLFEGKWGIRGGPDWDYGVDQMAANREYPSAYALHKGADHEYIAQRFEWMGLEAWKTSPGTHDWPHKYWSIVTAVDEGATTYSVACTGSGAFTDPVVNIVRKGIAATGTGSFKVDHARPDEKYTVEMTGRGQFIMAQQRVITRESADFAGVGSAEVEREFISVERTIPFTGTGAFMVLANKLVDEDRSEYMLGFSGRGQMSISHLQELHKALAFSGSGSCDVVDDLVRKGLPGETGTGSFAVSHGFTAIAPLPFTGTASLSVSVNRVTMGGMDATGRGFLTVAVRPATPIAESAGFWLSFYARGSFTEPIKSIVSMTRSASFSGAATFTAALKYKALGVAATGRMEEKISQRRIDNQRELDFEGSARAAVKITEMTESGSEGDDRLRDSVARVVENLGAYVYLWEPTKTYDANTGAVAQTKVAHRVYAAQVSDFDGLLSGEVRSRYADGIVVAASSLDSSPAVGWEFGVADGSLLRDVRDVVSIRSGNVIVAYIVGGS